MPAARGWEGVALQPASACPAGAAWRLGGGRRPRLLPLLRPCGGGEVEPRLGWAPMPAALRLGWAICPRRVAGETSLQPASVCPAGVA